MNKNIISLGLCMCSILLLTSAHRQKRSIFSVRKYNPLSPNEVQYYLQELQELKQRLNGGKSHGSKSRRRDRHSKKGECDQPIAYGNTDCTAHTVRYYYEKASKMCRKFHYTGCGGNKNNFHSKRECMRRCRH
ncbi:Kunitz-type protease inhibitor 1 [Mytilus galloprovincialis]|uniref:Kunitz-type protease inhibitor 1 n=1 Tax=Mytilus galloprovincialis TaxID=29158 RepID=A0A8B6ER65_MYTGA|nr:Kunitz-type protease inhibitor 1 [Mytilus galloprovincialis]